jgi:hypothetical protein
MLDLEVRRLEEMSEKGHVSLKLLEFQGIWVLRELDRNSQHQFVFLAFLGILVINGLGLWNLTIRYRAKMKHGKIDTDPNTETRTLITLQSTNLGLIQCTLVPDLSVDSDFNLVRVQRVGIILIELDPAIGERTMGVEEKRTVGEWKLESGVGSVLWTGAAPAAWLVRMMRFVGMVWFVGVIRFMRVIRLVGMIGFVGVTRGAVWMTRLLRMFRLVRMFMTTRRLRAIGRRGFAVGSLPAMMLNLLRFRPFSVLGAFELRFGIETSLECLLAFRVSGKTESAPIRNPRGRRRGFHRGR